MIRICSFVFAIILSVLSTFFQDVLRECRTLPEVVSEYTESFQNQEEKRILIIETTDMHGYLFDASSGNPDKFQYRLAYIANEIENARNSEAYDDVILLDGGDIYQGTPFSTLTGGAPMRLAFDVLGYDAVALGNHEFDWEVTEYAADQEGTLPPYEVGEYFGNPDIPVLCCNLYDAESMERVSFTQDYLLIDRAGVKTAVIGFIPDYSDTILREKIEPYYINDDLDHLEEIVKTIKEEESPDAAIVLVHGDPVKVAEGLDPENVDLVIGGHTHKILAGEAENSIPYMEGYCYGQGFASAVLVVDPFGEVSVEDINYTSIIEDKSKLYDTYENASCLDSEILEISRATWDAVQDEMGEMIGFVDVSVTRKQKGDSPSTVIGNWFTDLELRATAQYGTVAAFYNSGGIRSQFKLSGNSKTREITIYDIYSMAPFGNSLQVYELTAPEIAKLIEDGMRDSDYGDQMSGLSFTFSEESSGEFEVLSVTLDDGTELDLSDTETVYRVCISEYSATIPGSVFEGKEPVILKSDSPIDNESFIKVLQKEAAENNGYLHVDTSGRGTRVESEEVLKPAG